MNAIAQQHTQQAGHHASGDEFKGISHRQGFLTLPQDAQQGTSIEVLACKGSGCQCNSHSAQHGSEQCNQIQKLFSAV